MKGKKFVFPPFGFEDGNLSVNCPAGYITWSDLHKIYDKNQALQGNLRKAHKLSYRSLHPGNNKQNVSLALSIFVETTIAAIKSYFPERDDMSLFLAIFQKWWTIANSKQRSSLNPLVNAAVAGDRKQIFSGHWQIGLRIGKFLQHSP